MKELAAPDRAGSKVRRSGGGWPALTRADPTLLEDLRGLLELTTLGDPTRPLMWVSKSHAKLALALEGLGHRVSATRIPQLLERLGYRRQVNRKSLEGGHHVRLKPHTTWHLDEVYLKIDGRMVYLWRAVDAEGEVLDVLVQSKRNKHAALKLMRKLLKKYAFVPERLVTDDLRSYSAAVRDLGIERRHERGRWKNNRAENSHQPTRRRERKMQRFKSPGFSPEISFHTRRRLQYLQRPTPSHLGPNAPRASRCGDDHVAGGGRIGLTIAETPTLRARGTAT